MDMLQMQVTERALDFETIPANGLQMGATCDEGHVVSRRSHSSAEIAPDSPCRHYSDAHNFVLAQPCRFQLDFPLSPASHAMRHALPSTRSSRPFWLIS